MRIQTKQRIQHQKGQQNHLHVKKGDQVKILAGKDAGKTGTILEARPDENRVLVDGLNMVKRHTKGRSLPGAGNIPGGIIEKPAPLHVSNVQLICPNCSRPTRHAHKIGPDGKAVRACKHCGEMIGGGQGG
ncbi:MAG: 50S ribosomal protein L24 [Armatimonadetes bacterium]|nr:50S ribosomal protein L24 [Armatimonadota bacterium]